MKTIILFIAIALAACTSQPAYRAAKGDSPGYKEIALGEDYYRVQFKLRGTARTAAQNYALLRAAELTLAQGYDWFLVEKRTVRTLGEEDTTVESSRTVITRNCGLLGCSTSSYNLPAGESDFPDTETLVLLDIRMGRGVRPEPDMEKNSEIESYDSREIEEKFHQ